MTPWLPRQGNEGGWLSGAVGRCSNFQQLDELCGLGGAVISCLMFLELKGSHRYFYFWWWFWKADSHSLFCGMGKNKPLECFHRGPRDRTASSGSLHLLGRSPLWQRLLIGSCLSSLEILNRAFLSSIKCCINPNYPRGEDKSRLTRTV